uniref:Uncharacterized protein n=1 Tax=Trichuris muris TaxID=70415 RepID=A0A5S6QBF3_TRIMR
MTDVTSKSVVNGNDLDCYSAPPVEYEGIVVNRIPLVEAYVHDVVDEVYNLNDLKFQKAYTAVNGIAFSVVGVAGLRGRILQMRGQLLRMFYAI